MSTTIKLGGAEHPLLFNMNSLRNIMEVAGMETFADLSIQKDLAKRLGVTRVTVSTWCNHKSTPSIEKLILKLLSKSKSYLLPIYPSSSSRSLIPS